MSGVVAVILRAVVIFIVLMLILRMMGHRLLSQFTYKDYVIGISIGSIGARGVTKVDEPFVYFLAGLMVFTLLNMLLSHINLKSNTVRRIVNGNPIILIHNGRILEKNLRKAKMSIEELVTMLREKSIFNLSDVKYALMETHGGFSVLLNSEKLPLTPKDMNIFSKPKDLPLTIVKEGKIMLKELKKYNFSEEWVKQQLVKSNISDISKVLLAQADKSGIVYVCFYNG